MKRRRRWPWAIGAVVLVLLVLAAAALTLLRPERLQAIALSEARRTTGMAIDAGPASVRLAFSGVGLRVRDLRVAVADSSQLLVVERADATLKFRPLLRGRVELRALALHRPNLQVRPPAPDTLAARRPASSPFLAFLAVESWSVEDGTYGQNGPEGDLALTGVDLSGGFAWRAGQGATGSIRGRTAGGSWSARALSLALPRLDTAVDFRLSAAGDSLALPRVEFSSGALKIALSGSFRPAGRVWIGNLSGRSEPFTWSDVRGFLPAAVSARLTGAGASGRFDLPELQIERTVKGRIIASGRLRFSEIAVYGGTATGDLSVVSAGGGAAFTHRGHLALRDVDLGGALAEWFPIGRRLEGNSRAELTWTGRAEPGLDLRRGIELHGAFTVEEGAVLNVSGLAELAEAFDLEGATPARWPFRQLAAVVAMRNGGVTVDSLRVAQDGLGWFLSGTVDSDGRLAMKGLLRADPRRVSLPPEMALFAPYLAESDGRIPIDFQLTGRLGDPSVVLDWAALGKRAAAKARGSGAASQKPQ